MFTLYGIRAVENGHEVFDAQFGDWVSIGEARLTMIDNYDAMPDRVYSYEEFWEVDEVAV
jgi:hypothetical protein